MAESQCLSLNKLEKESDDIVRCDEWVEETLIDEFWGRTKEPFSHHDVDQSQINMR
jgi:hypothetical protein